MMLRSVLCAALGLSVVFAAIAVQATPPGTIVDPPARALKAPQRAPESQLLHPALPPDSPAALYIRARERLNQGEYREAADLFGKVAEHFLPKGYAADALYWQAFALYRLGEPGDLQQARELLEQQREQLSLTEQRVRQAMAQGHASRLQANKEAVGKSEALLDRQRRESRAHFEHQLKETAAAQVTRTKERQAALVAQQEANEKFLLELQERNRQSLAELDERRQTLLASYEARSRQIQQDFDKEARRRRSGEAREALEKQREATLLALEEQRQQSQTQLEVQRQQFLDAFARQRRQTEQALQDQQSRLEAAAIAGEEESRRLLAEIELRHRQTLQALQALQENREHQQQQFEEQTRSMRATYREQVQRMEQRFVEQREQSLALSQRIAGSLAQKGDPVAVQALRDSVVWPSPCDDEAQMPARLESLIALSKVDPAAVRPVLKQILDPKNKCSKSMLERAVFLLSLQRDEPAARMLVATARAPLDEDLRQQALMSLLRSRALPAVGQELVGLYEQLEQPRHRRLLMTLYARSRTPATTAKLIAIARSDEKSTAEHAIALLRESKDPRAREALKELSGGK